MSLHVVGRAVPTGAMHCWIYIPAVVGNLVKPPLIVAPAGLRFVSGLLEKAKVSACDGLTEINEMANPAVIAKILFLSFIVMLLGSLVRYFRVNEIGIKRS